MNVGDTMQLKLSINITTRIIWSSSNTSVLTVVADGSTATITATGIGEATITATGIGEATITATGILCEDATGNSSREKIIKVVSKITI